MTVTSTTAISGPYDGDDVETEFDYTFYIADMSELVVTLADSDGIETEQTLTTHYTVTRNSETGQGTFTMVTAPATGESVAATLNVPLTQATNLLNKGAFFAETHESAFDKLTRITQQLSESLSRCIRVGVTSGTDPDDVVTGNLVTMSIMELRGQTLLDSVVADNTSQVVELTSSDAADHPALEIEIIAALPATDSVGVWMQVSDNLGITWYTGVSDYGYHVSQYLVGTSAHAVTTDATDSAIWMIPDDGNDLSSGSALYGTIKIYSHANTTPHVYGDLMYVGTGGGVATHVRFSGHSDGATSGADGFQISTTAGNWVSGWFRLWGLPIGTS